MASGLIRSDRRRIHKVTGVPSPLQSIGKSKSRARSEQGIVWSSGGFFGRRNSGRAVWTESRPFGVKQSVARGSSASPGRDCKGRGMALSVTD